MSYRTDNAHANIYAAAFDRIRIYQSRFSLLSKL